MSHNKMALIFKNLLTQEPFYAGVMLNIRRRESRDIPTAAVKFDKYSGRFEMVYNPDFIFGMKTDEAIAIFKHELLHVVLKHVTDRAKQGMRHGIMPWNYATDLAINSHLVDELPKFTVSPEGELKEWQFIVPGQGDFKNYPAFLSSEEYLYRLMKDPNIKKVPAPGQGGGQGMPDENGDGQGGSQHGDMVGDHSGWNKDGEEGGGDDQGGVNHGSSSSLEEVELRRILAEGKRLSNMQGWGTCPNSIKEQVLEFLEPKIDWQTALRYFIKASQRSNKYSSFKKYNRRYPYQQPGRRVSRVANIAISVDQSGSVSDALLAQFFIEMNNLSKLATFTVIPFDWTVHEDKIFEWKKGQKKPPVRVASGGTNFNAPTEYVNKHNREFDGHIILTDMGAPKPGPSLVTRMWITSREYRDLIEKVAGNDPSIVIPPTSK